MSAVAHTHTSPARHAVLAVAVALAVVLVVLAVVLVAAPWRSAAPVATSPVSSSTGFVAVCPELPVSPC